MCFTSSSILPLLTFVSLSTAYQRVLFDNGYKIGNIVAFDEIAGLGLTGTAEDVPTPVRTKGVPLLPFFFPSVAAQLTCCFSLLDWVGYQKVTKADGEGFIFASKHPAAGFDHGANSFALMILGLVQTLLLSTTSTDFWVSCFLLDSPSLLITNI